MTAAQNAAETPQANRRSNFPRSAVGACFAAPGIVGDGCPPSICVSPVMAVFSSAGSGNGRACER